tara:strand:+ start:808 stop:957 length:150 start_codon:yes stop_codon:yes gene_type:complete
MNLDEYFRLLAPDTSVYKHMKNCEKIISGKKKPKHKSRENKDGEPPLFI